MHTTPDVYNPGYFLPILGLIWAVLDYLRLNPGYLLPMHRHIVIHCLHTTLHTADCTIHTVHCTHFSSSRTMAFFTFFSCLFSCDHQNSHRRTCHHEGIPYCLLPCAGEGKLLFFLVFFFFKRSKYGITQFG